MLITELKSKETIASLAEGKKVFIINCHGCKEVHFPEKEAEELQKEMVAAGNVTGIMTKDYICNPENMKLRLEKYMDAVNAADAVLVFSCGVGVQTIAEYLGDKPVYAACDTYPLPGFQGVTPLEFARLLPAPRVWSTDSAADPRTENVKLTVIWNVAGKESTDVSLR